MGEWANRPPHFLNSSMFENPCVFAIPVAKLLSGPMKFLFLTYIILLVFKNAGRAHETHRNKP